MDDALSNLRTLVAGGAPTLVNDIQSSLRDAIAQGVLQPGYRLREAPLAAHFGCSATPIREAIRKLEAEGLVTVLPRAGAQVSSFSRSKVEDLYELRLVLEPHAARRAAENRPGRAQLQSLIALIEQQNTSTAKVPDPPIDAEIHRMLADLAGNETIAELIGQTTRQIEAVQSRVRARVEQGTETAHLAHSEIAKAVADGDGERAERLMREHLTLARAAVLDSLDSATK